MHWSWQKRATSKLKPGETINLAPAFTVNVKSNCTMIPLRKLSCPVPFGTVGEICIHTRGLMAGYLNNEAENNVKNNEVNDAINSGEIEKAANEAAHSIYDNNEKENAIEAGKNEARYIIDNMERETAIEAGKTEAHKIIDSMERETAIEAGQTEAKLMFEHAKRSDDKYDLLSGALEQAKMLFDSIPYNRNINVEEVKEVKVNENKLFNLVDGFSRYVSQVNKAKKIKLPCERLQMMRNNTSSVSSESYLSSTAQLRRIREQLQSLSFNDEESSEMPTQFA
mgnify:CR=1 FL=1